MNHKIMDAAEHLLQLELEFQTTDKNEIGRLVNILYEMEVITNSLSYEEMMEVDDYIQEKMNQCST